MQKMTTPYTLPPTPSVALPPVLEQTWLALAQTETRATSDRDALHRLLPDITRLADRFTTARPAPSASAPPYLRTTREALAYTLYFAPQTYARTLQILQSLPLPLVPPASPPSPLRLLSLGSGTGADLLALLDYFTRHPELGGDQPPSFALRATAQDHSRAALRLLRDVFAALRPSRWPTATLRTDPTPLDAPDAPLPPSSFDIVTLHYVLNELPPSSRRRVLSAAARAVAPGGWLILCDPLLRTEGDYLRDLRTWAIENLSPLTLLAPCPHTGPCPLSEPCHSVRSWTIPRTLQILSTALHRDLRRLDYAFLAFRRPAPTDPAPLLPSRSAWTVASAHDLKGRTEVPACLPDGTTSTLRILHRHCDASTKKRLRHLDRGTPIPLPPAASP